MPGVSDSAGSSACSRLSRADVLLSGSLTPSASWNAFSKLNTQPAQTPVQRFKCGLTTALAWLGARVVRYSFSVRLFHSLLHAGLSRRYPDLGIRPTRQNLLEANRLKGRRA